MDYYTQALSVLPPKDPRRLEPYSELETICRVQGRWKDRKEYLVALRTAARESKNAFWIATTLLRHAQFDVDGGHLREGLSLAELCEQTAHEARSSAVKAQAQSLTAEILRDLGEMQGALAACKRALETVQNPDVPIRLRAEVLGRSGRGDVEGRREGARSDREDALEHDVPRQGGAQHAQRRVPASPAR